MYYKNSTHRVTHSCGRFSLGDTRTKNLPGLLTYAEHVKIMSFYIPFWFTVKIVTSPGLFNPVSANSTRFFFFFFQKNISDRLVCVSLCSSVLPTSLTHDLAAESRAEERIAELNKGFTEGEFNQDRRVFDW